MQIGLLLELVRNLFCEEDGPRTVVTGNEIVERGRIDERVDQ